MRCRYEFQTRAWEIELDGTTITTWSRYPDFSQAEREFESISSRLNEELLKKCNAANPSDVTFFYSGWGLAVVDGVPTVTIGRQFLSGDSAAAEHARLIAEKLTEGYVQSGSIAGAKEKREQLQVAQKAALEATGWPSCIEKLRRDREFSNRPYANSLKRAFRIPAQDGDLFMPVQSISYLGRGGTDLYWQCPNTPEHHLNNASSWEPEPIGWFEGVGQYYGFDFVAKGPGGVCLPLRVLINAGDGDCNDGVWGEAWSLEDGRRVAHIRSTGDCESTIEVISCAEMFEGLDLPILGMVRNDQAGDPGDHEVEEIRENGLHLSPLCNRFANNSKLERIIDLSIKMFSAEIYRIY